jgi:hypothetical protein
MRSWCFDSVATEVDGVTTYDREYGSAEFREVMRKLVGDGVYADPANNMQVTVGGGLSVSVLPGYCWVKGALGIVDEAETLTLDASSAGRTDVIVARFDLSLAARDIHLAVIKGTEGSTSAPALTRNDSVYDIQLARVRVNAGASAVALTDITDTRYNDNLCGVVTGIIDQIDATDLFAQYESIFNAFMEQLETVLSGDVAGNLLTLINNHVNDTNNPHNVTREQIGFGEGGGGVRLLGGTHTIAFDGHVPKAVVVTVSRYENNTKTLVGYHTVVMTDGLSYSLDISGIVFDLFFGAAAGGYKLTAQTPTHDLNRVYLAIDYACMY